MWTVTDLTPTRRNKTTFLSCQCDCGTRRQVAKETLRRGRTRSCGCQRKKDPHAAHRTREYRVWIDMRSRCNDPGHPSFTRYGGRGISVCDRWKRFANFLSDMGQRPSPAHGFDRINNDGNYEPGNCRWATRKEQQNNIRSNRRVTIGSVNWTVAQWSEATGTKQKLISQRLRRGWPERAAVFGKESPR
jgi:hypothetical protein